MNIFVYGTLRRGQCRASVLAEQRFVGEYKTAPNYRMFNVGAFPALVEDDNGVSVEGEIFEVDDETLALLDRVEGVSAGMYARRPVRLMDWYGGEVEGYIWLGSVEGMADAGTCW